MKQAKEQKSHREIFPLYIWVIYNSLYGNLHVPLQYSHNYSRSKDNRVEKHLSVQCILLTQTY